MADRSGSLLRFGVFEADARSGELRRKGLRVRLQEQPFQVLMMLADRPGEVITREELRLKLWPSDTFVDFDHGLNTAINKLRDALGDSATNPRFIETLPRRGYRFVASVERVDGHASASPASSVANEGPLIAQDISAAEVGIPPLQPIVQNAASTSETVIANPDEIPHAPRTLTRTLFGLIQLMYLVFYAVALFRLDHLHEALPDSWVVPVMVVIVISAPVGIALRLYLLTAAAFDYAKLGANFVKLFRWIFVLDLIWSLVPFLVTTHLGVGGAIGACAALVYVPFSQRTLIRMAYREAVVSRQ